MSEAKPFSKASQLARGERRYRRKVASPKQWQAIIEAKRGPCRVCSYYHAVNAPFEYHHLVARSQGGDDIADNIVPLHTHCHGKITVGDRTSLRAVAESLSDSERAYVIDKLGEGALERLFGVGR